MSLISLTTLSQVNWEHVWSYGGKVVILSRNLLTAAAMNSRVLQVAGHNFPHQVKYLSTQMKLSAIVGIPFALRDLVRLGQKIAKGEGVLLNSLAFTITAADVVDSITTFVNAVLTLTIQKPNQTLASWGMPLGFTMASLGTASRAIKIYRGNNSKVVDVLGIIANLTVLAALRLWKKGDTGPSPSLLISGAFAIRLSALIYQDSKT